MMTNILPPGLREAFLDYEVDCVFRIDGLVREKIWQYKVYRWFKGGHQLLRPRWTGIFEKIIDAAGLDEDNAQQSLIACGDQYLSDIGVDPTHEFRAIVLNHFAAYRNYVVKLSDANTEGGETSKVLSRAIRSAFKSKAAYEKFYSDEITKTRIPFDSMRVSSKLSARIFNCFMAERESEFNRQLEEIFSE